MRKKEKYDFGRVGRRLPYTVPDGFFETMEENVMQELDLKPEAASCRRGKIVRFSIMSLAAAAIVIVSMFFVGTGHHQTRPEGFASVAQAFNGLSEEDQEYLFSIYQDDIFINNF